MRPPNELPNQPPIMNVRNGTSKSHLPLFAFLPSTYTVTSGRENTTDSATHLFSGMLGMASRPNSLPVVERSLSVTSLPPEKSRIPPLSQPVVESRHGYLP